MSGTVPADTAGNTAGLTERRPGRAYRHGLNRIARTHEASGGASCPAQ